MKIKSLCIIPETIIIVYVNYNSLFKKAEDVDYNVLCIYKGLKNNEQGCTYFCRLELQITVKSIMIKKDYYMSM